MAFPVDGGNFFLYALGNKLEQFLGILVFAGRKEGIVLSRRMLHQSLDDLERPD